MDAAPKKNWGLIALTLFCLGLILMFVIVLCGRFFNVDVEDFAIAVLLFCEANALVLGIISWHQKTGKAAVFSVIIFFATLGATSYLEERGFEESQKELLKFIDRVEPDKSIDEKEEAQDQQVEAHQTSTQQTHSQSLDN